MVSDQAEQICDDGIWWSPYLPKYAEIMLHDLHVQHVLSVKDCCDWLKRMMRQSFIPVSLGKMLGDNAAVELGQALSYLRKKHNIEQDRLRFDRTQVRAELCRREIPGIEH